MDPTDGLIDGFKWLNIADKDAIDYVDKETRDVLETKAKMIVEAYALDRQNESEIVRELYSMMKQDFKRKNRDLCQAMVDRIFNNIRELANEIRDKSNRAADVIEHSTIQDTLDQLMTEYKFRNVEQCKLILTRRLFFDLCWQDYSYTTVEYYVDRYFEYYDINGLEVIADVYVDTFDPTLPDYPPYMTGSSPSRRSKTPPSRRSPSPRRLWY